MTISREDPRFWDVRTLDRRVRRGQVTPKDVEKHLKSLPDVADKAQPVELSDDDDDDDDYIDDDDDGGDGVTTNGVHTHDGHDAHEADE
jgi:hypothetical protein